MNDTSHQTLRDSLVFRVIKFNKIVKTRWLNLAIHISEYLLEDFPFIIDDLRDFRGVFTQSQSLRRRAFIPRMSLFFVHITLFDSHVIVLNTRLWVLLFKGFRFERFHSLPCLY